MTRRRRQTQIRLVRNILTSKSRQAIRVPRRVNIPTMAARRIRIRTICPPVVTALGATEFRPVGGPVPVAWREGTLTRAYELEALCNWVTLKHPRDSDCPLVTAIKCHLDAARQAARAQPPDPRKRFRIFRNGSLIERATSNLDAAEAQLLNLAPPDYVLGQMPSLLRHVQRHLRSTDPGRQEFERIARSVGINDPDHPSSQNRTDQDRNEKKATIDNERGTIVATVRAASSECLREQLRLRSFRNVVVITAMLMALLAVGVALTGVFNKTLVPLCFAPEESGEAIVVCPTAQSGPFIPLQHRWQDRPVGKRRGPTSTRHRLRCRRDSPAIGPHRRRTRRTHRCCHISCGRHQPHQGLIRTVRPARCSRRAQTPDWGNYRFPWSAAHAWSIRPRPQRT